MIQKKNQIKLTKEQIQAAALLSIGACLENFDRTMHLHIALIIDEVFFPQKISTIKEFTPAFSFCLVYLLTPLGAVIFGNLGDILGRKAVIILNSIMMSVCCLTIGFLPSYAQIGISATIILCICRMLQGMSSSTEMLGIEIYMTESTKPPQQYVIVALLSVFKKFGNFLAIALAFIFTSTEFLPKVIAPHGWRFAFLIGSLIGAIGVVARRSLKEATEFSDRQKLLKEQFKRADLKWSKDNLSINPKIQFATLLACFFLYCGTQLSFCLIFLHCNVVLKNTFLMNTTQILQNNLIVGILNILSALIACILSYKIAPMKIIKYKFVIFVVTIFMVPVLLSIHNHADTLLWIQWCLVICRPDYVPAAPLLIKSFPVIKRFRCLAVIISVARTSTAVITSFGLVLLSKQFGHMSILLFFIPFGICFAWAIGYFEQKEKAEKKQQLDIEKGMIF
jgi:MHS family proline/betaine transporter-like MFS transporter